ncbi:probable basic-leucine zipper transcription factor E [Palaemon carinicauda]|uniref:probable basic-leucine zipper transcription factor E n=1 Tax=Palaemon carinicauda TaxID=392227 RepID=UPI0035B5E35A
MPNLLPPPNGTQGLQIDLPDQPHSGDRFARWIPWLPQPSTTSPSPLPPLDPLQFLLRKDGRESLRRRSGGREKHKKTKVTFMTKQTSIDYETRCSSSSKGISAFTVLNFLLAAGNTVSNILNNNNNNDDNNNNNNNNALNLNVNSNNNNANNINNIDFGGPGRRRRRRRHLLADPGQQANETQHQVPETKDDRREREKATEIMMALVFVLDLSQAFRRETWMRENLENTGLFHLSHHFRGSENSLRRPRGLPDTKRFFFNLRHTEMAGDYVREAFEKNTRELRHHRGNVRFQGNGSDFFHGKESLSSSFVTSSIDTETNNSSEDHEYISNNNLFVQDRDKNVYRSGSRLSKTSNRSGNALSQREETDVENTSDKHRFIRGRSQVTDENRVFYIVCNSYRQADSFGRLTGFLVRVMTEEWLLPVYGTPVADC